MNEQGTRAVADLIESLGVELITDDRSRMDIHEAFPGGWQGLAQPVCFALHFFASHNFDNKNIYSFPLIRKTNRVYVYCVALLNGKFVSLF